MGNGLKKLAKAKNWKSFLESINIEENKESENK